MKEKKQRTVQNRAVLRQIVTKQLRKKCRTLVALTVQMSPSWAGNTRELRTDALTFVKMTLVEVTCVLQVSPRLWLTKRGMTALRNIRERERKKESKK